MRNWLKVAVLVGMTLVVTQILVQKSTVAPALSGDAPGFSLPDLGGSRVDLAALKGKVVALNFWATWCTPCRAELPDLAEVWRAHQSSGCFEILGVAEESGGRDQLAAAARSFKIPYPVLIDNGSAASAYSVDAYPRTVLIDAQGKVQKVFRGPVARSTLEGAIAPLLALGPQICRA